MVQYNHTKGNGKSSEEGSKMNATDLIKYVCEKMPSSRKVEDIVEVVYWTLYREGIKCSIVNEKGIELEGMNTIWFRRDNKNNCWKAFMVVDGKNEYL